MSSLLLGVVAGVLAVGVVLILAFCIRPSKPSNGPIVVINGAHVDVKALKQREQAAAQKGIQPVYGPNTADLPESHRAGAAAVAVQATPQMFARDADGNFLSTREQPMPSPRSQMGGNDSPPMLPPRPGPQMQVQQQPMLQQQMLHVSQVAIDQQANRRLPDIDQAGDRAYDHVAPIDPAAGMYVDIRTGARDDLRLYPQPPPRAVAAMPAKPASVNKAAPLVEMLPEPPMHGLEEPANQEYKLTRPIAAKKLTSAPAVVPTPSLQRSPTTLQRNAPGSQPRQAAQQAAPVTAFPCHICPNIYPSEKDLIQHQEKRGHL